MEDIVSSPSQTASNLDSKSEPSRSLPEYALAVVRLGALPHEPDSIERNTESPAEAMFYRALIEAMDRQGWSFIPMRWHVQWGFVEHRVPPESIAICPQEPMGRIRPDFILRMRYPFIQSVVVEVDGFKWHSAPEDKERDRKRDIMLLGKGYRVVRFTAREVFFNADQCAQKVLVLFDPYLDDGRPIWVRED